MSVQVYFMIDVDGVFLKLMISVVVQSLSHVQLFATP